jgi:K+-sensing histidine kinase KdpD
MRVELPSLLSVLSHELRGPISVIQGCARLLMQNRDPADPQLAMLKGILNASGRLAALARQADALRTWSERAPSEARPVSARDLLDRVVRHAAIDRLRTDRAHNDQGATVWTSDVDQLAAAIAALATFVERECPGVDLEIGWDTTREDRIVTVEIRAHTVDEAPRQEAHQVAFDSGGHGLALVLASYVLAAHHATVGTSGRGAVTVRLLRDRGTP